MPFFFVCQKSIKNFFIFHSLFKLAFDSLFIFFGLFGARRSHHMETKCIAVMLRNFRSIHEIRHTHKQSYISYIHIHFICRKMGCKFISEIIPMVFLFHNDTQNKIQTIARPFAHSYFSIVTASDAKQPPSPTTTITDNSVLAWMINFLALHSIMHFQPKKKQRKK